MYEEDFEEGEFHLSDDTCQYGDYDYDPGEPAEEEKKEEKKEAPKDDQDISIRVNMDWPVPQMSVDLIFKMVEGLRKNSSDFVVVDFNKIVNGLDFIQVCTNGDKYHAEAAFKLISEEDLITYKEYDDLTGLKKFFDYFCTVKFTESNDEKPEMKEMKW